MSHLHVPSEINPFLGWRAIRFCLQERDIFRRYMDIGIGFLTYSEGVNDDVNKFIWSGLGWNPDQPVLDILRDFSRYFIGETYRDTFAQGLLALERNWVGPLIGNEGVNIGPTAVYSMAILLANVGLGVLYMRLTGRVTA